MNRLRPLAAAPFVLALAVHLLLLALWHDRLPDPLATHFSAAGGTPDGFTGLGAYTVVSTGLLLALGAGWTLLVRRAALWGAWATAGLLGGLLALLLRGNLDAAAAPEARYPLAVLSLAAGGAGLAALTGLALTRLVPQEPSAPPAEPPAPRLALGAHEVAGWSRATGSRPLTALAAAFLLAGLAGGLLALFLAPWPYALIAAAGPLVGVPGLALSRVRVTVDRRGLTVTPMLLPRPRVRIPLDEVASAAVRHVDPVADFGGWGYRVRAHRTGLVLRSGEALVVRRDDGREFAVTVPDARTATALLDTLVERARADAANHPPAAPGERI
ncbi:hypothetical protein [Streptomyces roseoviridis]|uniref:DUF1648 domain-containing protein n=1 Tax=Streptomyces roseoviridis TaxID=67361 RepID=A0ABV5QLM7_9ACTN